MKNITLVFILIFTASCIGDKKEKSLDTSTPNGLNIQVSENGLSKLKAVLKTVHGEIKFRFYAKKAPNTTKRIIELIQNGFYDGITFHRVDPSFVIQTGDPTATGTGGSGKNLKAEFNDINHILGTVAMARASDPDSADSQFYIALGTLESLDGKYTVFGQVTEGIEILTKIAMGDKIISATIMQ